MIRTVLLEVLPPTHCPRRSYPSFPPEMCTWTSLMWLLQLEQVAVGRPEVDSKPSCRPAEMEMPSMLRSKLPLVLLKGNMDKIIEASIFFPAAIQMASLGWQVGFTI